jgi:hypothetical protein
VVLWQHTKKDRIGCHFKTCLFTMVGWSVAYRTATVRVYYETKSIVQTQGRLRQQFNVPRHGPIPSRNAILSWVRKLEDIGNVIDIAHGAPRSVCTEVNVWRVRVKTWSCSSRRAPCGAAMMKHTNSNRLVKTWSSLSRQAATPFVRNHTGLIFRDARA